MPNALTTANSKGTRLVAYLRMPGPLPSGEPFLPGRPSSSVKFAFHSHQGICSNIDE